jgi:hypothetical protein
MAQVKPYTGRRHGKMVFIAGYSRQGNAHRGAAPAERMGGGERIVDLMDSPDAKAASASGTSIGVNTRGLKKARRLSER